MTVARPARCLLQHAASGFKTRSSAWSVAPSRPTCLRQTTRGAALQACSARHYSIAKVPDFAFAFDIDGVLVRGSKALRGAGEALASLQSANIPFLLLTNGGGYHEERRARFLSDELGVPIAPDMVLQSHTPFAAMDEYKGQTALVVGGEHDNCRDVAHQYGFKRVVTPSDIFDEYPSVWPFSKPLAFYHAEDSHPRPLPMPIHPATPDNSLKIDAVFVYNDSRDWGLDLTIILDCLLSSQGRLGTLSPKNGRFDLVNNGYLQDGQPPLFFSNPDLWFAAEFALPRLGQGGFRAALDGLWGACTGGAALSYTVMGKPTQATYEFAEARLKELRRRALAGGGKAVQEPPRLRRVYMVGDNPESDIRGATDYVSPDGSLWHSALVRSGVYAGGEPSVEPTVIVDGVGDAVSWALRHAGWAKDNSLD